MRNGVDVLARCAMVLLLLPDAVSEAVSGLDGRVDVARFLHRHGFRLAVHGHTHMPYAGPLPSISPTHDHPHQCSPLPWVVEAGSASYRPKAGDRTPGARYNVYEVQWSNEGVRLNGWTRVWKETGQFETHDIQTQTVTD